MPEHVEHVEQLTSPPTIGETYIVPCVLGHLAYLRPPTVEPQWWPVLRPSHEDSKYSPQTRSIWRETQAGWEEVDEVFYEHDQDTPHHYHVDPRFSTEDLYSDDERKRESWHNTISILSKVEFREMPCLREMPPQVLFPFPPSFLDDHRDKKLKCMRCPHKGTNLSSMPVVDGVVTCPAHGLKFDAASQQCINA